MGQILVVLIMSVLTLVGMTKFVGGARKKDGVVKGDSNAYSSHSSKDLK